MSNFVRQLSYRSKNFLPTPKLQGLTKNEVKQILSNNGRDFVIACYTNILERSPSGQEISGYLQELSKGKPKRTIVKAFENSEEKKLLQQRKLVEPAPATVPQIRSSIIAASQFEKSRLGQMWMDLTTSLQWSGGVVGIVRAELELAVRIKRLHPDLRFIVQSGNGFAEILGKNLSWLLDAPAVVEAYMNYFAKYAHATTAAGIVDAHKVKGEEFGIPFKDGDVIFSCGWMDSQKEYWFTKVKTQTAVKIGYLIYDTILINEQTSHFYHELGNRKFKQYLKWASTNCDFLLFGGNTAQQDAKKIQQREGWNIPESTWVKFGTDIARSVNPDLFPALLAELGVRKPFIIAVGSIEPRKNYETLYRAYLLALEQNPELPQLVICGKPQHRAGDLIDRLKRDPRVQGRIIVCSPTEHQLGALYTTTLFTLLPSVYEGWSLTLPESLGYGKFCLCADTPPLREIGSDIVEYVEPFDVKRWADRICHFVSQPLEIEKYSDRIRTQWPPTKWSDSAKMVYDAIAKHSTPTKSPGPVDYSHQQPKIWMDLTLSYLLWPYGLNGIVRAELTLAYNLKILAPNTVFFAYEQNRFFVIDDARLEWLTEASSLSDAYASFQVFWNTHEGNGTGYRSPFRTPENTLELAAHEITSIPENTILFFAGIDMDGTGRLGRSKDILPLVRKSKGSIVSQLLYDMTPILFPHLHQPTTCAGYSPFVDFVANNYDHIVYGGQTCQKDAVQYYKNKDIPTPSGGSMKFGGNVPFGTASTPVGRIDDDDILRQLGITHKFVLSVGTIEPRKNHEVLYRALLSIFQDPTFKVDFQMVFVGRAGWNSNDLIETMSKDLRVKGKLIIVSPTDAQLDALYRQCEFTLLPTFYEGWSLTLPESFHHQKFCLAADVEPLKECGQQLAEYIHPLDNVLWAERIKYYLANTKALKAREAAIRKNWHPLSWREATSRLVEMLSDKWGTAQIEERKLPHE